MYLLYHRNLNWAWTFGKDTLCSCNIKAIDCVKRLHAIEWQFRSDKNDKNTRTDRFVSFDDWQVSIAFWRFALKYTSVRTVTNDWHISWSNPSAWSSSLEEIARHQVRGNARMHYGGQYYDWLSFARLDVHVLMIPRWIAINYEWKIRIIFAVNQSSQK